MKRIVGVGILVLVVVGVLGIPTASAATTLDVTLDEGTFTLGEDLAGDTVVNVTGTVTCTTDEVITDVQVEGILRQPKFEPIKLGAGDFEALFTCDGTPQEFDLVMAGPFHPGRAEFRLTAFACDNTEGSATCEPTSVEYDSGVIVVRIRR
jgi:hypothetical protein